MFQNDFQPALLIGWCAALLGGAFFLIFSGIVLDLWDRSYIDEETNIILASLFGLALTLFITGIGIIKKIRWLKTLFTWLLILVVVAIAFFMVFFMGINLRNERLGEILALLGFSSIFVILSLFAIFMLNTRVVAAHFGESHLNEKEQNDLLDSDFM